MSALEPEAKFVQVTVRRRRASERQGQRQTDTRRCTVKLFSKALLSALSQSDRRLDPLLDPPLHPLPMHHPRLVKHFPYPEAHLPLSLVDQRLATRREAHGRHAQDVARVAWRRRRRGAEEGEGGGGREGEVREDGVEGGVRGGRAGMEGGGDEEGFGVDLEGRGGEGGEGG